MTAHNHTEHVPGCFRCDLSREESIPTPERVTLTDEERALGQQHTPHRWFREDAVERIVAAREQALREEIRSLVTASKATVHGRLALADTLTDWLAR